MAHILHVEDSETWQTLVQALLKDEHTVESAKTLEEAIALIEAPNRHWDAILLDLNLPGFTGLLTLKTLLETSGAIPVGVLTGAPEGSKEGPQYRMIDKADAVQGGGAVLREEIAKLLAMKAKVEADE